MYQMLTGTHPFEGPSFASVQEKITAFSPLPAHEVNPDVPRRLSQICGKMMEKEPGNRYRNCRELLNELDHFNNSGEAFSNRSYAAGETIFEEGESGEYAFFIISGRVEIAKTRGQGRKVLAVLGKNEFVGELAIFTGGPRTASARAVEATVIRIMTRQDVARELDKLSPWVGRIITGLSHRFIKLNEKLLEELP
jgi:CRP-like cAMP-binding protein